jgi:hypothetical protein
MPLETRGRIRPVPFLEAIQELKRATCLSFCQSQSSARLATGSPE